MVISRRYLKWMEEDKEVKKEETCIYGKLYEEYRVNNTSIRYPIILELGSLLQLRLRLPHLRKRRHHRRRSLLTRGLLLLRLGEQRWLWAT